MNQFLIKLLKFPIYLLRRVLGVENIQRIHERSISLLWQQNENQKRILKSVEEVKQQLKKTNSLLEFSVIDRQKVQRSVEFERCAEVVSLLAPMNVRDGKFARMGRERDGGYVMLDHSLGADVAAAYSFGIANDASWDLDIAERGIEVYMYDHTVESAPSIHPRFHFFRIGLTGNQKGEDLETLRSLIQRNGHENEQNLIMKMDIEGCEWDVFEACAPEIINQFSQIVVELHGLSVTKSKRHFNRMLGVLKKLNQTHQSVHVHGNSCSNPLWIGNMVLPDILEVTYVRRSDFENEFEKNTRYFPTKLDHATFENYPDLDLGDFSSD